MISIDTAKIEEIIAGCPEAWEVLHPFIDEIDLHKTLEKSVNSGGVEFRALRKALERVIRRATEYPCNVKEMRNILCSSGCVNVAGFAGFLIERPLRQELVAFANRNGIRLNCNFFAKPNKKTFQNYLARCNSADDLPDILIGKGFSSLVSRRFIDTFLQRGCYTTELNVHYPQMFREAGLVDALMQYYPFAVEECVVVHDTTHPMSASVPQQWTDLVRPEYHGCITQMGNSKDGHFGSAMLLYLFAQGGISMVSGYAANVAERNHFAHIVKRAGDPLQASSPLTVMHNYAARMIRSDARQQVHVLTMKDRNPVTPLFALVKTGATPEVHAVACHLFSMEVAAMLSKTGLHPASEIQCRQQVAPSIRWIGWNTFRRDKFPYLKELLSEYAHDSFVPSIA